MWWITFLGVALSWTIADAAVVICSKKGKLTLRSDACKAKETAVPATELGVTGPKGDTGEPGLSGVEVVSQGTTVITTGVVTTTVTASCPSGKRALGGGAEYVPIVATPSSWELLASKPITTDPQGWLVVVRANGSDDYGVTAWVVCANAS